MLIVVFGPPQLSPTPIHQFGGGCILQHAEEELEADGPERQILVMTVDAVGNHSRGQNLEGILLQGGGRLMASTIN